MMTLYVRFVIVFSECSRTTVVALRDRYIQTLSEKVIASKRMREQNISYKT